MKISEYIACDALGLAELVRKKDVSPDEVTGCARQAIQAIDQSVQSVIETYDPLPASDDPASPFLGVPFLLKDVGTTVAGTTRECGSRMARGLVSTYDSALARRYRKAGLKIIGRAKSPEMAFNVTTESKFHGPVHNPWDLSRSAGGSSGGAGASVAARLVPMAEANDGGGSIRIPAACCGVVGLKPSRGRISCAPEAGEYLSGLSVTLAATRSVRDTAAMLDALQGSEPGDPYPVAAPRGDYLEMIRQPKSSLKIAVMTGSWAEETPVDLVCRDAVVETARLCEGLGHEVVDEFPALGTSWESFMQANARFWCINIAHWIDGLAGQSGRSIGPDTLEATTLACYAYGKEQKSDALLQAYETANLVSRSMGAFFEHYDILVTPALPNLPRPLGTFNADRGDMTGLEWTKFILGGSPFTPLFNVTGQPAISVPLMWSSENVPVGIQFAAKMGREDLLLNLAAQLEEERPWIGRVPDVVSKSIG